METATCRQMRGACEMEFTGETPEEMGKKCKAHVMALIEAGDADHKAALDAVIKGGKEEQTK